MARRIRIVSTIIIILLIINILHIQIGASQSVFGMSLWMIDVGQGDSMLLRNMEEKLGLIDAGKGNALIQKLNELVGTNVYFDFILLTHPDLDHIEGAIDLLDYYHVKQLFWNGDQKDSPASNYLISKAIDKNIPIRSLNANNDFKWGCCVFVDVLSPQIQTELEGNDKSISAKITFNGKFSLFASGDAAIAVESSLANDIKSVNMLKVGHHGSKTSTALEFVERLKPQVAFIGVGENSYGHPTSQVLGNLMQHNVDIWRTDFDGTIKLELREDDFIVCAQKRLECRTYSL